MRHTPAGAAFTELILELFRLNGCVLAEGDRLTAPEGLSSARWQVMGAIDEGPQTVSGIARRMGLTRQSVQRTVNELARSGIVRMLENPDHKRAKLVDLAPAGRAALDAVTVRQGVWANVAADGIAPARLADAVDLLRELRQRLESSNNR
ncbi:MAG: MarR family transcriptional regulator [Rhodospirillales bacterium]|nr:MarR family transcriptional regulator [Rhodospirillales bacterium]